MRTQGRAPTPHRLLPGWLCVLALGLALHFFPPVRVLELKLLDQAFAAARRLAPVSTAEDIAIIGIDDDTLRAFPEPIALWHPYLGAILDGLAQSRPRAIGIDIELPERSYDFVRPGSDRTLLAGLLAAEAAAPLVIARGVNQSGQVKTMYPPFLAAVGDEGAGLATWPLDADSRVRRFDERQADGGAPVPTFVGVLARRLGKDPQPGLIDFSRGPQFAYVPAHRVYEWARAGESERLREAFGGRVVLIGSVLPFIDRYALPVPLARWDADAPVPGILLHAQGLRSVLGRGFVHEAPTAAALALVLIGSTAWFALARLGLGLGLLGVFVTSVSAFALWLLQHGLHLPIAAGLATATLGATARVGHDAWFNRRERERLKRSFEGYVSPNVLDMILKGDLDTDTGTGRRMLCVLFADIRNFTPMSECAHPEGIVNMLNLYFERMTRAIHAHDGTVDNFRGDGVMCFFGAPRPTANPCRDGFNAAKGMLAALDELNRDLETLGLTPIQIGISLAYGEAIVGRIGAGARHEYTAIGDVANVSARLEGMTKEVGYPLVVSAEVVCALGASEVFDDLGVRELKGHSAVHAYAWPARGQSAARPGPEARIASHA